MGKLTDMIRATVVVESVSQMKQVYDMVEDISYVQIIGCKNKLRKLNVIFLNVLFKNRIICEIQIRKGDHPTHFEGNNLLYELEKANSFNQFR